MTSARTALGIALLIAFGTACGDHTTGEGPTSPRILSAFFGLDDALPTLVEAVCPGGTGLDGMPVVIDTPLADLQLDRGAFRVTKHSGARADVRCATLLPAGGRLERRTILLVGDLGDAPDDPPARVEITSPVATLAGGTISGLDFANVTPLEAGAGIVIAERYAFADVATLVPDGTNQCPRPRTLQIVNVLWQGGIDGRGGTPLGDNARLGLHVTLRSASGAERVVEPFALGDLEDRDNHLQLCLDTTEEAVAVRADPGLFFDPRNDANPDTTAPVTAGVIPPL